MAIKIGGIEVIDDSKNIVNAVAGTFSGALSASNLPANHNSADGQLHVTATSTTNNGKVLTAGATAGSFAWSSVAGIPIYTYDNRGNTRSLSPDSGSKLIIEGLGLFNWISGSVELDDDETAFATSSGVWLLVAADPEYVITSFTEADDEIAGQVLFESQQYTDTAAATAVATSAAALTAKILRSTFSVTTTSVAAITAITYVISVIGAQVGDGVLVNPGNSFGTSTTDQSKLSHAAYISGTDAVTITIRNASASTAAMTASTWTIYIIKQ